MSTNEFGLTDSQQRFLDNADARSIICYLNSGGNEYNGDLGARISAIFVILFVSTAVTFFPVLATRSTRIRVPLYVYLFARYFGAGVIVATAFIHLLDPAYEEIGPASCVGMTGGWASYSWTPALALTSAMLTFLMEFVAEVYVEKKYGLAHSLSETADSGRSASVDAGMAAYDMGRRRSTHQYMHSADQDQTTANYSKESQDPAIRETDNDSMEAQKERAISVAFQQQITAFLILEFGVLFHSVIIGLALGTAGEEFSALYPVIVFHQSFEGLGIGARLSAIPFPKRLSKLPWLLCIAYGLCTPIAIAAALGVRTTYNAGSYTANVVSGVLDSISAGILLYTGFVELIARDFLFNPERTKDNRQLAFMVISLFLGTGIMALLGKWA